MPRRPCAARYLAFGLPIANVHADLESSIIAENSFCDDSSERSDGSAYGPLGLAGTGDNCLTSSAAPFPPQDSIVASIAGRYPLAENAGEAKTHALKSTSLAIDHGNNNGSSGYDFDQRGPGFA